MNEIDRFSLIFSFPNRRKITFNYNIIIIKYNRSRFGIEEFPITPTENFVVNKSFSLSRIA